MKRFLIKFIFAVLFVFSFNSIFGITIDGKAFLQYSYNLSENSGDYNSFDVTRLNLNFKEDLEENIKFKATADILRQTDAINLIAKYIYINYEKLFSIINLKAGLIDTPWIGYEEKIWEFRVVSPIFLDLEKKLNSADLGIEINTKLPENYGEIVVSAINGEGYKKPEINKFKDIQIRITIAPLAFLEKNLKISGFYTYGIENGTGTNIYDERKREIMMLSYQNDFITLAGEYWRSVDQNSPGATKLNTTGIGTILLLKIDKLTFLNRIDELDTDKDDPAPGYTRIISGIAYKLNEKIVMTLDNQVKTPQDKTSPTENVVSLHSEINF
jgi:hypothetical protein